MNQFTIFQEQQMLNHAKIVLVTYSKAV